MSDELDKLIDAELDKLDSLDAAIDAELDRMMAEKPLRSGIERAAEGVDRAHKAGLHELQMGGKSKKREVSSYGRMLKGLGEVRTDKRVPPEELVGVERAVKENPAAMTPPKAPETPEEYNRRMEQRYTFGKWSIPEGLDFTKRKGHGSQLKARPAPEKGHPVDAVMTAVDAPFRALGGIGSGISEVFHDDEKSLSEKAAYVGKRTWDSVTGKDIATLGDAFNSVYGATVGRDLEEHERTIGNVLGIVAEIAVGGKMFPRVKSGPKAPAIGRQIKKVLRRVGVKAADDFARLGEMVMEAGSHPARMERALNEVGRIARKHGIVDEMAVKEAFLKHVGLEGGALGIEGITGYMKRGPRSQLPGGKDYIRPEDRIVPYGAGQTEKSGVLEDIKGQVQHGAENKHVASELRGFQSKEMIGERAGLEKGAKIDEMLGKASDDFEQARVRGFKGKKLSPEEAKVAEHLDDEYMKMAEEADAVGLRSGDIRQYFEPIERSKDFSAGKTFAMHKRAHAKAVAAHNAEGHVLSAYGTPIDEMTDELWARMKKQGLTEYTQKFGNGRGQKFLVNRGAVKILDRMTDPAKLQEFDRQWQHVMGWWKTRALSRPGYVMRNVLGGNVPMLWLADANITRSMKDATRLQALRHSLKGGKGNKATDFFFRKNITGGDAKIGNFGKYTPEETLKLAEELKVLDTGGVGYEIGLLGGTGVGKGTLNPWSRNFFPSRVIKEASQAAENNARLALFTDRLKKGYSAEEAAAAVAKYLFNYDEITGLGRGMRKLFPFATWSYKNWGLQLNKLMTRPDKLGKYERLKRGAEEIDPLDPVELEREEAMGSKKDGLVRLPFTRGDKGEREYFDTRSFFPMEGSHIVTDPSGAMISELGGMLGPVFNYAVPKLIEATQEDTSPGRWSTSGRDYSAPTKSAPAWVSDVMADPKSPLYGITKEVFQPRFDPEEYQKNLDIAFGKDASREEAHRFAEKHTRKTGYLWDKDLEKLLFTSDPVFGSISRLFKDGGWKSWLLGLRTIPYGDDKAAVDKRQQIMNVLQSLRKAKQASKSGGKRISDTPYREKGR